MVRRSRGNAGGSSTAKHILQLSVTEKYEPQDVKSPIDKVYNYCYLFKSQKVKNNNNKKVYSHYIPVENQQY